MPLSSNINSYSDVQAVLEAALPAGQAEYRLATQGKAVHWMQRANKFRLLLQKQLRDGAPRGQQPPTPFDRMRLTRKGASVLINFNPEPEGTLSLPGGKTITPEALSLTATPVPQTDDALSLAAQQLIFQESKDED